MSNFFKLLYAMYGNKKQYIDAKTRIENNKKKILETLSKDEQILLLNIEDDFYYISEKGKEDSFNNGVITGAKLMLELLNKK